MIKIATPVTFDELTLDGVTFTEAELANIEKSLANSLRLVLKNVADGLFNYKIGEKSVSRSEVILHLLSGIEKVQGMLGKIPHEAFATEDYLISDFGEDFNQYIGDN